MGILRHSLAALWALLVAPFVLLALLVRPHYRTGIRERLGGVSCPVDRPIWVHGASVGESRASARLLEVLLARGHNVVASVGTQTGRQALALAKPGLPCILAPLDHPWCVERALSRVAPAALVLIETELWPSWIAAAKRRGIPVMIASGRLSDRSFPRYRKLRRLFAGTMRRLDVVAARSPLDAERFAELGVPRDRIRVTGDLKLEPSTEVTALATDLVRALSEVAVFVAGSTHEGEEEAAIEVLKACEQRGTPIALVVAPRHPDRVARVEALLSKSGFRVLRRSELDGDVLASGDVLLLDTIGELPAVYSAAALAFVGGTLANIGGHNLIEPLFAGCPVIFGPNVLNVRTLAEVAQASGAGFCVEDAEALVGRAVELLDDVKDRRRRGMAAQSFLEEHRGGATRVADLLDEIAPPPATEPAPTPHAEREGDPPPDPPSGSAA